LGTGSNVTSATLTLYIDNATFPARMNGKILNLLEVTGSWNELTAQTDNLAVVSSPLDSAALYAPCRFTWVRFNGQGNRISRVQPVSEM